MTATRSQRLGYAAWIAICLIWGTTFLAIKISLETIPPLLMGGLRYVTAGSLVTGLHLLSGGSLPSRTDWPRLALMGLLMLGMGNGGVVLGEQWVASGLAAVIVATTPFWMVGLEAIARDGERLTRRTTLGLLVGFGGIVLLVWPDVVSGNVAARAALMGLVSLQVACFGWALGSMYSRRHLRDEGAVGAASMQMIFGGLSLLAAGTVMGEWPRLAFSVRTGWALTYLVTFGAAGGYVAYVYALKHLPVSTVSLYAYINPVIAVVLGAFALGERLDWAMALAMGIILTGVAIVSSASRAASGQGAQTTLRAA